MMHDAMNILRNSASRFYMYTTTSRTTTVPTFRKMSRNHLKLCITFKSTPKRIFIGQMVRSQAASRQTPNSMAPLKLYYFPLPGRAETARLMLSIGKVDFEDKIIPLDEWFDFKPQTPFGQLPFMEIEGKRIAQMCAIDHYCATLTGMMPSDPLKLAEANQAYCLMEDIWSPLHPMDVAHFDEDLTDEEREEIYKKCLAPDGDFKTRLGLLDKLLAKRENKFLAGDKLCFADLKVFSLMSDLQSGWLTGLPTDILAPYPAIKEFRNMIASLPEVAKYYETHDDEIRKTGFRPDQA